MRRLGTSSSPRVADIVGEAGLSNDAFYRHFASKDEFVATVLDVGTERLAHLVAREMGAVSDPADKVRAWVEVMMRQAHA